jgi:predicted phosphodiesterase
MKISITSDEHLEFADHDFDNVDSADVLILGGDILVAQDVSDRDTYNVMGEHNKSNRLHAFMQRCAARFPHVIYIVGNHEHYHSTFTKTVAHLKEKFAYLSNLHILDREVWTLDDVTFIGGTLWTDMNNGDALTLYHMKGMMNDFRIIDHGERVHTWRDNDGNFHTQASRFQPEDALEEHIKMKEYIRLAIEGKFDSKFVVVGHHAPSRASIKPRYASDHLMNGGYSSDLSEFILDHPQIKLWTHGHTHDEFDYMVGTTRVVCNPRGYQGYESRAEEWKLMTVEV